MTPLGVLNFLVLQWFGVRLARRYRRVARSEGVIIVGAARFPSGRCWTELVPIGWTVTRWVWPLTGWWSEYRWIARRS